MTDVVVVPCLADNYAYLVPVGRGGDALVVDPSEAGPVRAALAAHGLRPVALLCTHHHGDHVGGVAELAAAFVGVEVVAHEHDRERIGGVTRAVTHGERLTFASGARAASPPGDRAVEAAVVTVEVRHVPGHTLGAVAYVVGNGVGPRALFTGDTLFVAGCGRLFEGTADDMFRSLVVTLGDLPDDVEVFCGHEYTEANLRFATHVEPTNEATRARVAWAAERRRRGAPTVPSTLGDERATNPFVRVLEPTVAAFAGLTPGASGPSVLGAVRAAKNAFR